MKGYNYGFSFDFWGFLFQFTKDLSVAHVNSVKSSYGYYSISEGGELWYVCMYLHSGKINAQYSISNVHGSTIFAAIN